ncbi:MAG: pyroglutamyl-peptidase I [Rhizobiales bacterium]|nr:pyroglutamyl-peptidase I [Hyphomicrobiales bacterium]
MPTILLTGFGPFPGAPVNPTGPLVRALKRSTRQPSVKLVAHVFMTDYAAVDRDLPKLLKQHKPDALLMFGLATRARLLRVETLARNVVSVRPDVGGKTLQRRSIVPGARATMTMRAPARALLAALRKAQVPARLSRDAGDYLCNYLCWRATEAAARNNGPRLAAFIHIPPMRRGSNGLKPHDLARAGRHVLTALTMAARR